ncbi:gephyrin-like molybdotransferase Glp [Methanolacinia petrolearia]|uniref:molybdopterin molybdotransferase MoeA n=1 Tax=Methanolacinia petrolearia TaxID=54120 RepID=UPI003BA93E9E
MKSSFLSLIRVDEAVDLAKSIAPAMPPERVLLDDALGRVLSEDVRSDIDIPGFDRSWKDGYAVFAADTTNATDSIPSMLKLKGRIDMGAGEKMSLSRGECFNIPTGGQMPDGADAVVMVEYTDEVGGDVLVKRPVAVGENVVKKGEDFPEGGLVFGRGEVLSASDLGALAAIGYYEVPVMKKPVVGIISTGIEIVPVDKKPKVGEVRDVNSYLCSAFVRKQGGIPLHLGIVRDNEEEMISLIRSGVDKCDLILISGGSSKDIRDITARVLYTEGEVLAHGVMLAPGKPTIIAKVKDTPVIGIPGHPAATYMVLSVIVRHLLVAMAGFSDTMKSVRKARFVTNISSEKGREEYVRIKLVAENEAMPLFGKSGLLNTIVESDGVIKIPAGREGLEAGEEVEVFLW